jgi:hypothetical protein
MSELPFVFGKGEGGKSEYFKAHFKDGQVEEVDEDGSSHASSDVDDVDDSLSEPEDDSSDQSDEESDGPETKPMIFVFKKGSTLPQRMEQIHRFSSLGNEKKAHGEKVEVAGFEMDGWNLDARPWILIPGAKKLVKSYVEDGLLGAMLYLGAVDQAKKIYCIGYEKYNTKNANVNVNVKSMASVFERSVTRFAETLQKIKGEEE